MWHRVSTPPVLAWFLGATSSWNEIMDLLWVRLQGDRLEFGEDRVGAPAPMARSTTDTERLGER